MESTNIFCPNEAWLYWDGIIALDSWVRGKKGKSISTISAGKGCAVFRHYQLRVVRFWIRKIALSFPCVSEQYFSQLQKKLSAFNCFIKLTGLNSLVSLLFSSLEAGHSLDSAVASTAAWCAQLASSLTIVKGNQMIDYNRSHLLPLLLTD